MRVNSTLTQPVVWLVAAALVACGKRGDPVPPLRRMPQVVTELTLAQRGQQLEIRLQAPRATTEGARLGVVTLEVLVSEGAGAFPKGAVKRQLKAAPGERLVLDEPLPPPGTVVRVAATATSEKRTSALSPVHSLVVAASVPPPTDLEAQPQPDGVRIRFAAPEPLPPWIEPAVAQPAPAPTAVPTPGPPSPSPPPAESAATGKPSETPVSPPPPTTAGFRIYRRAGDGVFAAPLSEAVLREVTLLDAQAPLDARSCYTARTVVSLVPLVESEAADEACVAFADIKAPLAPIGVASLAVEGGVEVSWSPSPEPDLFSYRVYRRGPTGEPTRIGEVKPPRTSLEDRDLAPGARFVYFVTAVDLAGNESARSAPAEGGQR